MISFYKLSGGGNDFIALIDSANQVQEPTARQAPRLGEEEIRALCTRGLSLGSDGLFYLSATASGAQMDYFNADGRPANLCLNGARCAARLAHELGWAGRNDNPNQLEILTGAGVIGAHISDDGQISLEVPPPGDAPTRLEILIEDRSFEGYRIQIGVPYFVVPWPVGLALAPVAESGPELRRAPELGSDGANIDFVRFTSSKRIEMRVFERGVEAETLASGTGALAAIAVGVFLGETTLPARVQTLGGFDLLVEGEAREGLIHRWVLSGDARLVASGELAAGAAVVPSGARWSD